MKPLILLGMLAIALAPIVGRTETRAPEAAAGTGESREAIATLVQSDLPPEMPSGVGPHPAASIDWEAQLYHTRPLVIFADSPENPQFTRQIQLIERDLAALEERRVVVVLDSDPAAMSEWRKRLRPNGFSLVLLDIDLKPVTRKPSPWDVREISRAIDKLPSRRQDLSQQFPSGR